MAKLILSPLLIVILILWPTLLIVLFRGKNISRVLVTMACVALAIVTVSSMSNVAGCIEQSLENGYSDSQRCPADAVVVLSGGYVHGRMKDNDQLSGESVLRLMKGVDLFKQCNAKWLVLSGSSKGGLRGRDGELMQALALKFGIQKERILNEIVSANTREHPTAIAEMGLFGMNAELAVVTSPWHLRRAMREFKRAFPRAYPVMAYVPVSYKSSLLSGWVPQCGALSQSTRVLHEYIGYIWYKAKALVD